MDDERVVTRSPKPWATMAGIATPTAAVVSDLRTPRTGLQTRVTTALHGTWPIYRAEARSRQAPL